jgi:hypothetical protein
MSTTHYKLVMRKNFATGDTNFSYVNLHDFQRQHTAPIFTHAIFQILKF